MLANPISLPVERLVPDPELFAHKSDLHGQQHVARVTILGFLLIERLEIPQLAPPLWAACYLHDLGRLHDGRCIEHGNAAIELFENTIQLRQLFAQGGVKDEDYEGVYTAVINHCLPQELPTGHPHRQLTALLKDADGLDRVRLGDLDQSFLRFDTSRPLIPFAQALYDATQWSIPTGPAYMTRIWPVSQDVARRYAL